MDPSQGGGGDAVWWDEEAFTDLPAACDLAKWYVMHVPLEYIEALVEKLEEFIKAHPEDPHADDIAQFIVCFHAM